MDINNLIGPLDLSTIEQDKMDHFTCNKKALKAFVKKMRKKQSFLNEEDKLLLDIAQDVLTMYKNKPRNTILTIDYN